jgi:hypothetical protein
VLKSAKSNPAMSSGYPWGVNHWHGATDTLGIAHIAISYVRNGSNVTWRELVTDDEFAK